MNLRELQRVCKFNLAMYKKRNSKSMIKFFVNKVVQKLFSGKVNKLFSFNNTANVVLYKAILEKKGLLVSFYKKEIFSNSIERIIKLKTSQSVNTLFLNIYNRKENIDLVNEFGNRQDIEEDKSEVEQIYIAKEVIV